MTQMLILWRLKGDGDNGDKGFVDDEDERWCLYDAYLFFLELV